MKNHYILILGVIIILALGVCAVFMKSTGSPLVIVPGSNNPVACTEEAKLCPDGSAVGRSGPNCQFAACPSPSFVWTFDEVNAGDPSQTAVTLTFGSRKYPLGNYQGSCSTIEKSNWPLLPGEKSGSICYFAGAGTEFGVFEETGKLIVKKGTLEEGDAEHPGTRGDFKTLFTLGSE